MPATGNGAPAAPPQLDSRSNAEAQILLDTYVRFFPEMARAIGVEGVGQPRHRPRAGPVRASQAAFTSAARELDERRVAVKDPRVLQDLEILRQDALLQAAIEEANQRYLLPNFDVAEQVYSGVRALLTDQVAPERQPALPSPGCSAMPDSRRATRHSPYSPRPGSGSSWPRSASFTRSGTNWSSSWPTAPCT